MTSQEHIAADAEAFVVELARSLGAWGTAAHRLEGLVQVCAQQLGVEVTTFALPTAVLVTIDAGDGPRTRVVRFEPGEPDIGRLVELDGVVERVASGELGPRAAAGEIRAIADSPARYGRLASVGSFAIASGCVGRFLGGSLDDALAAGAVGLAVGLLAVWAGSQRRMLRLVEFCSGVVAAMAAVLLAGWLGAGEQAVTLAGLIILLPGMSLTVAVHELSQRHLVAGTARLMGAVAVLVTIGFGIAVGHGIADRLGLVAPVQTLTRGARVGEWIALLVMPIALVVLFRVGRREMWAVWVSTIIGYVAARSFSGLLGMEIGACLAAFVVGGWANLYSRMFNRPVAVAALPGVLVLVPGSVGMRSIASFLEQDTLGGVETAFRVVIVAIALVVGLLVANAALPARKAI